jgi:hypothetical protein
MENGLAKLQAKYLPQDRATFAVFGQSYVAMIRKLRNQIDELLNVAVVEECADAIETRANPNHNATVS